MIVVVNSTPLIYLAAIDKLDLLRALFGQIVIPMAVFDEVVIQGAGQWGAAETAAASWISRRVVTARSEVGALAGQLDLGESEVEEGSFLPQCLTTMLRAAPGHLSDPPSRTPP